MRRGIVRQRLVAVFVVGCVLLCYPMMALFDRPETIGGIPLLYAYVFGVWVVLIVVLALIVGRR
jgi:hypothetical protein